MKWPNHGGQPEAIKKLLHLKEEKPLLDFSANLNPLGPPSWLADALQQQFESITRYPDPTYSKASAAVAEHEGIDKEMVLLTSGGAEAIFLVAKYFEQGKALIVHPSFLEYERACAHYHIDVEDLIVDEENGFDLPVQLIEEKLADKDVMFLCRPNNPTGTVIPEEDLQHFLEIGQKNGTYVVVDEAFVDFLPSSIPTLTSWLSTYPNLILLRSLTKMYTIPGLRIGYIMAHPTVIQTLKNEQIPWSINSLVDAVVPRLLEDREFVNKTKSWLHEELRDVCSRLTELDYSFSPSLVNFYLLQDRKSPDRTDDLFYFLLENGILTRHTHNFKGLHGRYIRIAIRSHLENQQLLAALQKWRNES
ncbi:threonine-phosphate decarboxylase CobD [Bacillus nitroreducens]